MTTRKDIEKAIIAAINADAEDLRKDLQTLPEKVADTVRQLTPVLTGETEASIEVKSRKSELKKLGTRRTKLGEVYSDDDPERVNSIEFGRGADEEHGETPEHAMFRRAAALWQNIDL